MRNTEIPFLPERPSKPRETGITMIMEKGLSPNEGENLVSTAGDLIDIIKLGFGTSVFTRHLKEKIRIYHEHGVTVYVGGTLFEAFVIRNMFDDYKKYIDELNIKAVEVSDGSMFMPHEQKCRYIQKLAEDYLVISEVGSKDADKDIPHEEWISQMHSELEAGSFKVIAEARESGTVGIYDKKGEADTSLIDDIISMIDPNKIIWEAPLKSQQVWFIKHFGANVNLGNIAPGEIIPLETLRLGLRGDTFLDFLPDNL